MSVLESGEGGGKRERREGGNTREMEGRREGGKEGGGKEGGCESG
jgi:hypothetical protein